jgi:hypothetical protein
MADGTPPLSASWVAFNFPDDAAVTLLPDDAATVQEHFQRQEDEKKDLQRKLQAKTAEKKNLQRQLIENNEPMMPRRTRRPSYDEITVKPATVSPHPTNGTSKAHDLIMEGHIALVSFDWL